MEPSIFRLIDHAHAATTQLLDNAVMRDGLADHWRRILRGWNRQVNETREVVSTFMPRGRNRHDVSSGEPVQVAAGATTPSPDSSTDSRPWEKASRRMKLQGDDYVPKQEYAPTTELTTHHVWNSPALSPKTFALIKFATSSSCFLLESISRNMNRLFVHAACLDLAN